MRLCPKAWPSTSVGGFEPTTFRFWCENNPLFSQEPSVLRLTKQLKSSLVLLTPKTIKTNEETGKLRIARDRTSIAKIIISKMKNIAAAQFDFYQSKHKNTLLKIYIFRWRWTCRDQSSSYLTKINYYSAKYQKNWNQNWSFWAASYLLLLWVLLLEC